MLNPNTLSEYARLKRLQYQGPSATTVTPEPYPPADAIAMGLQPYNDNLYAIASVTGTSGVLKKTAQGTWILDSSSYITTVTSQQITSALGYTPVSETRTLTINGVTYDLTQDRSWTIAGGVTSFNTRTGAITLLSSDITSTLGYTPYNASNPAGYISSFTETDPTVGSHIKAITITNISNWNTTYGWGNHALVGYLTGITSGQVTTALGYTPYNASNPNGYISGITSSMVTTALGYTPENLANKGVANGYASLDGSGLVPATQLPSYVDDVLEYTDLASFPATGVQGKIYVDLTTNKVYRWSGTVYIEVSAGSGTIWGGITGTLANQTDLQSALDSKVPTNRTLTINGITYDLSANRSWTVSSMVYPSAGIAVSTGTAWGTSITDNSTNWNTAYSWGNHATVGYLTFYTETDTLASVTTRGNSTSNTITVAGLTITTNPFNLNTYIKGATAGFIVNDSTDTYNNFWVLDNGNTRVIRGSFTVGETVGIGTGALYAGAATFTSSVTANSFVKSGGTSSQFLKADGSVDAAVYLTGITSLQVTTALGYTPYNSTNPNGYTTNTGTVTSVSGTGTVSGLTLTGTVTTSGSLTLGGTLSLTSGQVTTALGYTPYNSTNPNGYITSSGSISGNAATTSQRDFSGDISTSGMGRFTGWYTGNAATGFAAEIGVSSSEVYILGYNRQTATYGAVNIATSDATLRISGSAVNVISGILQQAGNHVLHAGNYNSYSPTLTGGGASGTWGIRTTGFANTGSPRLYSTDASYNYDSGAPYYGYLTYDGTRWLFQVSPGTPASVRVAYSDYSGTATNVAVSANNTSADWFPILWHSGNGVYSSAGVQIYAGGNYIRSAYINTTDNLETGITRFLIKNGDDYHRSATTTTAADIIRGVASGTWSISVTGSAGSAASATTAGTVTHSASRTDSSWYNVLWGAGNPSQLYSCDAVQIQSSSGSIKANIYYDNGDTGYYLDPAGTSNLNKFSEFTMSYNGMNAMSANSPYAARYSASALYRNGTMGYGTTSFNVMGSNWGSGFIDSWGSPAAAPGGSTHYVGLQGMHYNNQDSNNFYGFQMACAGEADNRFFWRSAWSSPRSWVEMIHSGNIGSQSVNYASSAGSVAWTNVSGRPTTVSSFTNDSGYITSGGRAYPRRSDGGDLNFYWSGQSGQPPWLWGGSDGTNMYVYNPSNFSVNYATTAGTASNISAYTINQNLGTGNSPTFADVNASNAVVAPYLFVNNQIQIRSSSGNTGASRIVNHVRAAVTGDPVNMIQLTNLSNTIIHFKLFFGSNDANSINSAWTSEWYGSIYFNGSGSPSQVSFDISSQNGNGNNGNAQLAMNPSGYSNSAVFRSGNATGAGGLTVSMTLILWGKGLQSAVINYL